MIDFLEHKQTLTTHKRKRKTGTFILIGVLLVLAVLIIRSTTALVRTPETMEEIAAYQADLTTQPQSGMLRYMRNFFIKPTKVLKGEIDDRINILLLGMGGAGHEGPFLTDTIILTGIKPSTGQISMISIPRDLAIDIPDVGVRRINTANSIGEQKKPGEGAEFAREIIENTLGQGIPYVVRINFAGFEELINELGGLDIYVERSFVDNSFPAEQYEYRTVSFQKGWEHMDGARALEYARSRHGSNGESSDFARARRQQHIINALKDKLISFNTVINPARLKRILDSLGNNVSTNIELWELIRFASFATRFKDVKPTTAVIDARPDGGLLYEAVVDGAFLLFPQDKSYKTIRAFIENVFEEQSDVGTENKIVQLPARVEIHNGTWRAGLAAQWKQNLEEKNIAVADIGNALERPLEQTTIFITNQKESTRTRAEELAKLMNANIQSLDEYKDSAALRASLASPATDILIVLGEDSIQL
ncbi:MAG TPA: hypothetical protein DDW36_00585 [Candidatus Magasanikbacteria bacterium]|nr:hypothetical protein [Candidatus Magasanikbacteria bacterium]